MTIPVEQQNKFRSTPITRPRQLFPAQPSIQSINDNITIRSSNDIIKSQLIQNQYNNNVSKLMNNIETYTQQYKDQLMHDIENESINSSSNQSNTLSLKRSYNNATTATNNNNNEHEIVRRSKLSKHAVDILTQWFNSNIESPYPSDAIKLQLSEQTGLNCKQVHNWYTNHRKRTEWKSKQHRN